MAGESGFDFKNWYAQHGRSLNQSRRERYASDPEYRQRVLEANRESRQRKREDRIQQQDEERAAKKYNKKPHPWKELSLALQTDEGLAEGELYTIGALARLLGCSVQAIRLWEAAGVIAPPEVHNRKRDRLYTWAEMQVIYKVMVAQGRIEPRKVRETAGPGSTPARWRGVLRAVRFPDGLERKVKLYRIGALALSLGRTILTVEQMETRGILPSTPFRASSTGYRLYTAPMIRVAKKALLSLDGNLRGDDRGARFAQAIRDGWTGLGVIGAKLLD